LVQVCLHQHNLARKFSGQSFKYRPEHQTRLAPFRPEIDDDRNFLRTLDHLLRECRIVRLQHPHRLACHSLASLIERLKLEPAKTSLKSNRAKYGPNPAPNAKPTMQKARPPSRNLWESPLGGMARKLLVIPIEGNLD
jgi:hypothetical protein